MSHKEIRDDDGLSLQQRRVLAELALGKTISEVAKEEDIKPQTIIRSWMRIPAFKAEYDGLFDTEDLKNLKKTLNMSAVTAVGVYEDAMSDAYSHVKATVTCPHCNKTHDVTLEVIDWKARLHAADSLMKISGILTERREVKQENRNVNIELTGQDVINLMAWRAGRPIPPLVEQRLRDLGQIQGEHPVLPVGKGDVVEGDYHQVE